MGAHSGPSRSLNVCDNWDCPPPNLITQYSSVYLAMSVVYMVRVRRMMFHALMYATVWEHIHQTENVPLIWTKKLARNLGLKEGSFLDAWRQFQESKLKTSNQSYTLVFSCSWGSNATTQTTATSTYSSLHLLISPSHIPVFMQAEY
jgi:hypothetical protein